MTLIGERDPYAGPVPLEYVRVHDRYIILESHVWNRTWCPGKPRE